MMALLPLKDYLRNHSPIYSSGLFHVWGSCPGQGEPLKPQSLKSPPYQVSRFKLLPVKWTNLTRQEISELLKEEGIDVSVTVVDQLLEKHNYRKRKAQRRLSSSEHPQRNEQFENIEELIESYQAAGKPVLSMDTKKKNS